MTGCPDSRPGGDDAGTGPGTDSGPVVIAPPGALALVVERASWVSDGAQLEIGLRLSNGAGGDPAPLNPASFAVRTTGGAEVAGAGGGSTGPCRSDLSVGPGGSVSCSAVFSVPTTEMPMELVYRTPAPDTRDARAALVTCSPSAPGGVCSSGSVCLAGRCEVQCSAATPDGLCSSASELCRAGECVAGCSPAQPDGACAVGVCRAGMCDSTCSTFTGADPCFTCIDDVVASGSCSFPASCEDYCAFCPGEGGDTCSCLTEDRCEFDCPGLPSFWFCALESCPSCS